MSREDNWHRPFIIAEVPTKVQPEFSELIYVNYFEPPHSTCLMKLMMLFISHVSMSHEVSNLT